MSLGKDLERRLEGNAKVMPCAPDSPEQVGMAVLGSCDYTPVCKNYLARDHVVVEEPVFSLQSAKTSTKGDTYDTSCWA